MAVIDPDACARTGGLFRAAGGLPGMSRAYRIGSWLLAALLLAVAVPAAAGEPPPDDGLFGRPAEPEPAELPVPEPEPELLPPVAPRGARPGRLGLTLDFDYRRIRMRPEKIDDKYDDFVGDVHYDIRLDLDDYSSRDAFQNGTLALTLHWRALEKLEVWASLRRPLYGKAEHGNAEYDGAPVGSPKLELDQGATVEVAVGAEWEALHLRTGPLRHFGLCVHAEFRAGWADNITSPDEEQEFDFDGDDQVEYDADWMGLDLEVRAVRFFPDTLEGSLRVWAGVGVGLFFYHEAWDGDFDGGDEREKMEFDFREEQPLFGALGVSTELGRFTAEVSGRLGGQKLLHASLGWRF